MVCLQGLLQMHLYLQQEHRVRMQAAQPVSGGQNAVGASAFAAPTAKPFIAGGTTVGGLPLFKPSLAAETAGRPAGASKKRARFAEAAAPSPAADSSAKGTGQISSLGCFLI
jgi:hypothetical protein